MKRKINILFIETGVFGGGSFESLYSLLKHINRERYNPKVIFLNHTKYLERMKSLEIKCYMVKDLLYSVKGNYLLRPARGFNIIFNEYLIQFSIAWEYMVHFRALRRLKEIIKREKIDIIHANDNINRDFFCLFATRSFNVKIISHLRSFSVEGFNKYKVALANKHVDKFIAITETVKDLWSTKGLKPEKISVVHNGIEPVDPTPVDVKGRLGLPQDCFLVGAVGSYNADRGYENLLKAFAMLLRRSGHIKCEHEITSEAGHNYCRRCGAYQ